MITHILKLPNNISREQMETVRRMWEETDQSKRSEVMMTMGVEVVRLDRPRSPSVRIKNAQKRLR